MILQDGPILVRAPGLLTDVRVEVIVPSLSALLPDPAGQVARDQGPLFGPVLPHQLLDHLIFFGGPRPFDERGFEDFLPSVETLNFGAVGEVLGDELPVFGSVFVHGASEGVVLS